MYVIKVSFFNQNTILLPKWNPSYLVISWNQIESFILHSEADKEMKFEPISTPLEHFLESLERIYVKIKSDLVVVAVVVICLFLFLCETSKACHLKQLLKLLLLLLPLTMAVRILTMITIIHWINWKVAPKLVNNSQGTVNKLYTVTKN